MAISIDQYPAGDVLVVPSGLDLTSISYHVSATERIIPVLAPAVLPNLGWFPVFAIRGAPTVVPQVSKTKRAEVVVNDQLTRIAFYLTRAEDTDGKGAPIDIQYQIRAAMNCTSEVVGTGIIQLKAPGFGQVGMIAQVSGWLCNQWELWARTSDAAGNTSRMTIGIDVMVDRLAGTPREFVKGSVSI